MTRAIRPDRRGFAERPQARAAAATSGTVAAVHERRIAIRWADVGHDGRVAAESLMVLFDELLSSWLAASIGDAWVTLHVELDLGAPLHREDREATGRVELERLGRSSIGARLSLSRPDGEVAATGRYVIAAFDPIARRTRPLTPADRAALEA